MNKFPSFILPLTIAFLITVIVACAGAKNYIGKTVDQDSRIKLEEGSQEGIWQPFDLRLEYQYERSDNMLRLSGIVQLSEHYTMLYPKLYNLYFYLFLIDKEGNILESKQIINAISSDIEDKFPFKQELVVPTNTVSISFGYDGVVAENYDRDYFSNYPHNEKHSL